MLLACLLYFDKFRLIRVFEFELRSVRNSTRVKIFFSPVKTKKKSKSFKGPIVSDQCDRSEFQTIRLDTGSESVSTNAQQKLDVSLQLDGLLGFGRNCWLHY